MMYNTTNTVLISASCNNKYTTHMVSLSFIPFCSSSVIVKICTFVFLQPLIPTIRFKYSLEENKNNTAEDAVRILGWRQMPVY